MAWPIFVETDGAERALLQQPAHNVRLAEAAWVIADVEDKTRGRAQGLQRLIKFRGDLLVRLKRRNLDVAQARGKAAKLDKTLPGQFAGGRLARRMARTARALGAMKVWVWPSGTRSFRVTLVSRSPASR